MRKLAPILLLLAVAGCSSFASQRVRQYNFAVEEAAKQLTIYADAGRITADQGDAIIASLKIAASQIDRYWAGVESGAPRSVQSAILDAIVQALNEATAILAKKETPK